MNRYKNGKIFSLFLMCGILGACDKFEAIPLEYKSTPLEEAHQDFTQEDIAPHSFLYRIYTGEML